MKIKTKLLTFIGGPIILLLLISFSIMMVIISSRLNRQQESQIQNQTLSITKQVEDLITTSAKSYLSAIGDKSDAVTDTFFKLYNDDNFTLEESRELALKSLTEYKFLKSGYIFVTDRQGFILAHPNPDKIGTISPVEAWIKRLQPDVRTYKEFEEGGKNKIVYRVYNPQYDFNICVAASTSEFIYAVDRTELNKTMNTIKIGKSGYPFLVTKDGTTITEPNRHRINNNILGEEDIDGNKIYQNLIEHEEGFYTYSVKELDNKIQERFISFKLEPHSELIIVVTGYTSEIYDIVKFIITFIVILAGLLFTILITVIYTVSNKVTEPIQHLTTRMVEISHGDGDLTERIKIESNDEIGLMVKNFNYFLDHMQEMVIDIKHALKSTTEINEKIIYRVNETSSSVKKISANVISIKNHTKQINPENSKAMAEYVIKSMDYIVAGSTKISKSMEKINSNSAELDINSGKLKRRVHKFRTQ